MIRRAPHLVRLMSFSSRRPNLLAKETSPYLLQHQYNPVNWYPWGKEALEAAKKDNRPILLSIGYSTCHWCHVMERESFEKYTESSMTSFNSCSKEIAKIMNDNFVSVKVDREERPDVDRQYGRQLVALRNVCI